MHATVVSRRFASVEASGPPGRTNAGPLNYNPVEELIFQRLAAGRPVCVPGSGLQVTQMGHVQDLAEAFVNVIGNPAAAGQIYNISGEKYVTFDGFVKACAKAMGGPEPEIIHYKPKDFDFGKKKAFPFRDQHFFASIDKAKQDLHWAPKFDLVEGLRDSYEVRPQTMPSPSLCFPSLLCGASARCPCSC